MSGLNGRNIDRLLINVAAEPIDVQVLRSDVKRMIANPGIWVAGDRRHPEVTVPLASMEGKIYAMKLDDELAPHRFAPTATLAGPYTAQAPAPDQWIAAADELPEPDTLVLIWFATGDVRTGQWNAAAKRWGPPRSDRYLKVQPTHWMPIMDGPAGAKPNLVPSRGGNGDA